MRPNGLAAHSFNARRLELSGEPITLPDAPAAVGGEWLSGWPVTVSAAGTMAYIGGPARNTKPVWFDMATGKEDGTVNVPPGFYDAVAFSPDGKRAAISRVDSRSKGPSGSWISCAAVPHG
ncbi:MAG TPA: hypothetical protein VEL51_17760 [Vicinamibacterales bacterium]|nr:hypothetical protein [Vicinamibacterales bacterium]